MNGKYILDGKTPVAENDLFAWGKWLETADRKVASTKIKNVRVSTVFLGLDHNFNDDGPPLLFETIIFGGPNDQYQTRASTWDAAVGQHAVAVSLALTPKTEEGSS